MGLYPPGKSGAARLTQGMKDNMDEGIGMPPFKVRNAEEINTKLGLAALPDGFAAVPIMTYANSDIRDEASIDGCKWIQDTNRLRKDDNSIWDKYDYLRNDTREPIK